MLYLLLFGFFMSVGGGTVLTWTLRNWAFAHGWVREPASARHVHKNAVPRLGGVSVLATVAFTGGISILAAHAWKLPVIAGTHLGYSLHQMLFITAAAAIAFAAGLYDDIAGCRPWLKISAQVIAGLVLFAGHIRIIHLTSLDSGLQLGQISSAVLTVLFVLLVSNAFNLIDGLDGLAAGSALFATITMFVVALANDNRMTELLTVILAGAVLGFLRYNFNPATIFLGDCGSLFIGTFLAGLALTGVRQEKSSTMVAVSIPVIAFGLPIVETCVTFVRRLINGRPIFNADREHIHHKLLDRGWSQTQAVVALYTISAVFGLLSLLLLTHGAGSIALVLIVVGVGSIIGVQRLGYQEFHELSRIARRTWEQKGIMVNNLAIRRGTQELIRCRTFAEIGQVLENTFGANDFDGFSLRLRPAGSTFYRAEFTHSWQKQTAVPLAQSSGRSALTLVARHGDKHAPQLWTVELHLKTPDGSYEGAFVLSRRRSTPLMVDLNLLLVDFDHALAVACQQAVLAAMIPVAEMSLPLSSVAAAASGSQSI